jgi:hypothetical protein
MRIWYNTIDEIRCKYDTGTFGFGFRLDSDLDLGGRTRREEERGREGDEGRSFSRLVTSVVGGWKRGCGRRRDIHKGRPEAGGVACAG